VVTSTGILRGVNGGGLEIKGIKKRYGDLEAVRDLSFAVKQAEVFGFVGSSGAGKTTTMRIGPRVKLAEAWRGRT
jgi:ABC-2 type transport system ATP-binding protein